MNRRLCLTYGSPTYGSPTYAGIIEAILDRRSIAGPAVELLHADPQHPVESALYLRLLGAVHRIAIGDPACPLRQFLPSTGGAPEVPRATAAFFEVVAAGTELVERELQVPVQTNEVGRSAPLSAARNHLASSAPGPFRLLEVGASAGLNLWLDRYFVAAGPATWGPPDSPVQLRGQFAAAGAVSRVRLARADPHGGRVHWDPVLL